MRILFKHLFKTSLGTDLKHRLLLILIFGLSLCTLALTLTVTNLQYQVSTFIAGAKTMVTPAVSETLITKATPVPTAQQDHQAEMLKISPTVKPLTTSAPAAPAVTKTNVVIAPTDSVSLPPPSGNQPYPTAPECPAAAHSNDKFHTLWNPDLRCHYDHEHGEDPFTAAASSLFPGFSLTSLLGGAQVGHTNLSGSMENTHKHGGFKWQATLATPENCAGFEGARNGVNAALIQYHNFGDYSVELESAIHTAAALVRQCNSGNPGDYGYMYTTQFQNYGQVVVPYQGTVFNYPHTPVPAYPGGLGPYLSVNCIGSVTQCRSSLSVAQRNAAASNWTSKSTGSGTRPQSSTLLRLLFRINDTYQNFDWNDQTYPFTFLWLCTSDGGRTFNPERCRYNNTTTQVHEIAGEIPASWDNLAGFDRDSRPGRITADGFTTRFGTLNRSCSSAGPDCHPVKMVGAFVGTYGSVLFYTPGKGTNLSAYHADRDIYFCSGRLCTGQDAGSVPSGWVGPNN